LKIKNQRRFFRKFSPVQGKTRTCVH